MSEIASGFYLTSRRHLHLTKSTNRQFTLCKDRSKSPLACKFHKGRHFCLFPNLKCLEHSLPHRRCSINEWINEGWCKIKPLFLNHYFSWLLQEKGRRALTSRDKQQLLGKEKERVSSGERTEQRMAAAEGKKTRGDKI